MKPILLAAALACFIAPACTSDHRKQVSNQTQQLASPDPEQRRAPAAKVGGLLNTAVTPAQAKRVTEQTNRQIMRKSTAKRTR